MKSLILALQFMTRLPLPAVAATEREFAAAIRWLPATGAVVGAAAAGGLWLGARVDPWLGALGGLAAWVLITGALHLDGLGDMADAAGAAHKAVNKDRAWLSAVLADPHVGSFGVVAIGLQLLAKLVLLHGVGVQRAGWLIAVAIVARLGPLAWTLALPPLHQGLGSLFRQGLRWWHLAIWGVAAACALPFAPWLGLALPAMALWGWWVARRIGGISGDGLGAGIELTETVLLLGLMCWR